MTRTSWILGVFVVALAVSAAVAQEATVVKQLEAEQAGLYAERNKLRSQLSAMRDKLGKEAKTFSADLWHKPEAGVTIAASTDKRPEAPRPAAVDFLEDDDLFS